MKLTLNRSALLGSATSCHDPRDRGYISYVILGMLFFVLCFEILSGCTPRKDGVLETPSFSKVVEVVIWFD